MAGSTETSYNDVLEEVNSWRRHLPEEAILFGLFVLGVWEVGSPLLGLTLFLPQPSRVLEFLITNNGLMADHTRLTIEFTVIGGIVGSFVGILLALVAEKSTIADRALSPLLMVTYATPKIVIAPILVMYIGINSMYFTLIPVLICFFSMFENTKKGLEGVPRELRNLSKIYNASRWHSFRHVQLPSLLPHLMAGLKVATMQALVGVIVAEFAAPRRGLGYLLLIGMNQSQVTMIFGSIVIIGAIGLGLYVIVDTLERNLIFWREM